MGMLRSYAEAHNYGALRGACRSAVCRPFDEARGQMIGSSGAPPFQLGPYRIDFRSRRIYVHSQYVELKPKSFDVAALLLQNPGTIISREELYERIWGAYKKESRTIDVHISWVRTGLELDGRHGWLLSAVRQHGYLLQPIAPRPPLRYRGP
jgi:DNA-binding response OmpR family regulator